MERKRLKLERSLGGVRNMHSIPSILFITDCHKEQLALKEAKKLGITVVGVSDTNCDPTGIDYMIPGNDDSPRAVSLYANVISTAVIEGLNIRAKNLIKKDKEENYYSSKLNITPAGSLRGIYAIIGVATSGGIIPKELRLELLESISYGNQL